VEARGRVLCIDEEQIHDRRHPQREAKRRLDLMCLVLSFLTHVRLFLLTPVFSTLRTTSIYANRTTILTENPQLWMWRMVYVTETGRFFQSAVSFKSLVDASPSHPTTKFDTGYQTTNNKGPIAVPHSV
jgi:hypothetical protein